MGEIHGIVYIIIGVFFSITSKILDVNREENKLTFFVILGIIMILVGIGKLLVKGVKEKAHEVKTNPKKHCHKCGTMLHSFQEFCHKCGTKLFK